MFRKRTLVISITLLLIALILIGGCRTTRYTLNTSVSPDGAGTVNPSSGTYDDGAQTNLSAIPTEGYAFDHWSGDASGASNPMNVTMDGDKLVIAHFKAKYQLSVSVSPDGAGTVNPSSGTYDDGTQITLIAIPTQGYAFDHWSGNATSTSSLITITMYRDEYVIAHFRQIIPGKLVVLSQSLAKSEDGAPTATVVFKNVGDARVDCVVFEIAWYDSAGSLLFETYKLIENVGPGITSSLYNDVRDMCTPPIQDWCKKWLIADRCEARVIGCSEPVRIPPCRFHGHVTVDGAPAPDGTTVTAVIEGDEYVTTTPAAGYGTSMYAITIIQPLGKSYHGKTVTFKIGNRVTDQTAVWATTGNLRLDLSVD
jgi:hypothetical protein